MFIDTHCHLDDLAFSGRLPEIIDRGRSAGIVKFIVPGISPSGWQAIAELGRKGCIYPSFGLHPMHAALFSDRIASTLEELLPQGVATGEIGLDYTFAAVTREVQMVAFREQLRLSVRLGLPVLLHCRRAFKDLATILKEERVWLVGGTMHAFSGSPEIARECLKLGLSISVAGPVTYPNAVKPLEVVRQVPLDSLLLETDSPDLAPAPYRNVANEPAFMVETAKKIAELKGVPLEEVAVRTTANAEKIFRFKERNSHAAQILPQ